MNERIKELAAQACDIMPLYDSINRGDYTHSQYNMQIELLLEKFAELIIRECIGQVEKDIEPELDDSDYAEHWNMALRSASNEIKNYFGVEE